MSLGPLLPVSADRFEPFAARVGLEAPLRIRLPQVPLFHELVGFRLIRQGIFPGEVGVSRRESDDSNASRFRPI
jgi:hypothetical protein